MCSLECVAERLQLLAVLFNLVPVPPLDGYQMVEQFLSEDLRMKIRAKATILFFAFFIVIWRVPGVFDRFHLGVLHTLQALGFDRDAIRFFLTCYDRVLFSKG